ncbi:transcription initiation factor TFIID subunit 4 isoform X2 [Salmo salar]|uniref:Transcription initiation factor TFIID subunit 4 isoform X2 n=1 Tax=Salmo salar TaxID=8030 RepID=A0A1S3MLE4_SALSA|nr:transcription initiation factor TFIID subunit 4 isoform X2 [Salmo salar]|eukprot:XP_014003646.1 PREDICTED: transcription initiation factor TFIID subunit 4-like isoform X2 [Salmo salar]
MAGASDPLEDMLFNEVDEKAVSDLVGSLESQLVSQKTSPATYSDIKREGSTGTVSQFSGKVRDQVGSLEPPQQGHPKAVLNAEPCANQAISNKSITASTSSITTGGIINAGTNLQTHGVASRIISPAPPGSVTLPAQTTSFNRGTVLGPAETSVVTAPNSNLTTTTTTTTTAIRTPSPGLQSFNGSAGAVKLVNSPAAAPQTGSGGNTVISTASAGNSNIIVSMASQPPSLPNYPVSQSAVAFVTPAVALQRHPNPMASASQNGLVDLKVSAVDTQGAGSPGVTTSQVMNRNNTLINTTVVAPNQPVSADQSIILGGSPAPVVNSPVNQAQSVASPTLTAGVKPTVNGVGQSTVTIVRPPGAPVMATSVQQQRPGLVASPTRTVAPQMVVRPPQQTTIQLPPGFTIPPGMVLVRTDTGQLVMVPQQVLAQAQAKTQQGQAAVSNISPRPATPTAGATIRVSTPSQAVRLASPVQARMLHSPSPISSATQAITVAPVSVKMTTPQKAQTVITGGQALAKPGAVRPSITLNTAAAASASTTPTVVTSPVSQEMQENVKKCKNFLATLIKLASHNSPSPDTSKNVKALVQDLLDAKIEPEEFTTRLQAELKSSPQPYLIPFLKKSLPALRLSLLNNQQSLLASTNASALAAASTTTTSTIRARFPTTVSPATGIVRTPTTALGVRRPGVQGVQTRMPMVIPQTIRPQGTVARGLTIIAGRSPVGIGAQASANQKKLNEPGGGTFRDDDDINDVASMAGVNLNEENARIMATNSELVGTKIRSCKDEAFLPPGLLHRRIMETAKRFGVTEVPAEAVNYISHATQARLRSMLEKVSTIAQHRTDGGKDEEWYEPSTDVRAQLRFFEQLDRMEKQRKDEQEREVLLKAAKSRARQEDPEQARLKAKAKEMQQAEQAQIRQREANLTALAAIGPRKKRKMDSPGSSTSGTEVALGSGAGSSTAASSRQQLRQRITRVNLRDFIFCLEQERATSRSLLLYKALLK